MNRKLVHYIEGYFNMSEYEENSSSYEIVFSDDSEIMEPELTPLNRDLDSYIGQFCWQDDFINNESHAFIHVDISNVISEITGSAWGIEVNAPVVIKLVLHGQDYRKHWKPPRVDVYQFVGESKLYQLECILHRFLECLWALNNEKPWEQRYMDRYENEITPYLAFIESPCDAVLLHRLFKKDVDVGLDFYARKDGNLFNLVREYLIYRIPTICQYCLHCDETPIFLQGRDMQLLKPFVCGNQLCHYQLSQLNMGAGIAGGIAGSANLIHLLAMMTVFAAQSKNWREKIIKPFPTLVSHEDPTQMYLDPENPDYDLLAEIASAIPTAREAYTKTDGREFREMIDAVHPYGNDLLQWITSSNRAHITDIPDHLIIPNTGTAEQYLMLLDSPAKEAAFQELKAEHGTKFVFHGSPFMNFHSILRNGLYNASGTKLQRHGTAHGKGVYLSPSLQFAIGYCKNQGYRCLALCEVIDEGLNKKTGNIWTIEDPSKVCTRFLFVYKPKEKSQPRSGRFISTSQEVLDSVKAVYEHFGMLSEDYNCFTT